MQATRREILTVGHSTRAAGELEALLLEHGVALLLDVRAHPGSRRMPHFSGQALQRSLGAAGIDYRHVPELGGRRRARADSPNGAWRNDQFRGYADHMDSEEFRNGLDRVIAEAVERRACLMCAEAVWWRCHRRLVADAMTVRGWRVMHVAGSAEPTVHELPEFAQVRGDHVRYPPAQGSIGL